MVRYPAFVVFDLNYSCGIGLVGWHTDRSGLLQSLKDVVDFLSFCVLALGASEFERLLEECLFHRR